MLSECLILSVREYKENSLIVSVLQPRLGRQEVIAKGGKQIKAKLTPWLQPLRMVDIWLAPTRGERAIVKEVEIIENFTPSSPLALKLALKMADLLEKALPIGLEAYNLSYSVRTLLRRVKQPSTGKEELTKLWIHFELVLLSFLGIAPSGQEYQEQSINELARTLERRIYHFLSL